MSYLAFLEKKKVMSSHPDYSISFNSIVKPTNYYNESDSLSLLLGNVFVSQQILIALGDVDLVGIEGSFSLC